MAINDVIAAMVSANASSPVSSTLSTQTQTNTTPSLASRIANGEVVSPFMSSLPPTPQTPVQAYYNGNGFSDVQAASILENAGEKLYSTQASQASAAARSSINAKLAGVKDLQNQVQGERLAAGSKLVGAIGGTAFGMSLASRGAALQAPDQSAANKATGVGMSNMASSGTAAQAVTAGVDFISKTAGGDYQADQAKIQGKQDDALGAMYDQVKDATASAKDSAKKFWDSAVQFVQSHNEVEKSTSDNILK